MTKIVVTDKALRELVREAMFNKEFSGWSANEDGPAHVNSNVDPSAAVTDPVNPNFTPQTKTEFGIAVNQLVKNLPDTQMSGLFKVVKTAIDKEEENKNEENMKKKATQSGSEQVEEAVRRAIRKVLIEMNPRWARTLKEAKPFDWKNAPPVTGPLPPVKKIPAGEHGGEYNRRFNKHHNDLKTMLRKDVDAAPPTPQEDVLPSEENPDAVETPGVEDVATPRAEEPVKRHAYKSTAIGGVSDVGGASFDQIAKELGFSIAGAKQAVDKALEKARFLGSMDDDDREILVLTSMNDYVKRMSKTPDLDVLKDLARKLYVSYLNSSEELTPADLQLMQDHPGIVSDLDGFKEYEAEFMKNPIAQMKANPDTVASLDDFREFLHNSIRRARKAGQALVDPLEED